MSGFLLVVIQPWCRQLFKINDFRGTYTMFSVSACRAQPRAVEGETGLQIRRKGSFVCELEMKLPIIPDSWGRFHPVGSSCASWFYFLCFCLWRDVGADLLVLSVIKQEFMCSLITLTGECPRCVWYDHFHCFKAFLWNFNHARFMCKQLCILK